jgi:hypothetical protein
MGQCICEFRSPSSPKKNLKEIKYKFQDREGEGGPGFVK